MSDMRWTLLVLALLALSCDWRPYHSMPATVPKDAVEIPMIGKSKGWAKCWLDRKDTRCRIFNINGEVVADDVFLPLDGGADITASELHLVAEDTSPDYVWLTNGRVLLPRTNFAEHKEFADRILK